MDSLKIDFSTQRGHEMVIFRDPPLLRGQMDEVDLNMLQAERIPRLLPLDWIELDGSMTFRYAIAGRRLLSHKLIGGPFGMKEYMELLLGIVEALEECTHYLLREQCCLIHERFLFVGEHWSDVRVAYLPMRDVPPERPVREQLLGLAVRLTSRISRVDGEGLQDVLRLLGDSSLAWQEVRSGLLDALGRFQSRACAQDEPVPKRQSRTTAAGMTPEDIAAGMRTGDLPEQGGNISLARREEPSVQQEMRMMDHHGAGGGRLSQSAAGFTLPARGWLNRLRDGIGSGEQPEDTSLFSDRDWPGPDTRRLDNRRARWLGSAGALLSIAAAWRYIYLPAPGNSRLFASIGVTLLVLWGLSVIWRKLRDVPESERMDAGPPAGAAFGEDVEAKHDAADGGWAAWLRGRQQFGEEREDALGESAAGTVFGHPSAVQEPATGGGDAAAAGWGVSGSDETSLLKEETVLLSGQGGNASGGYCLVREFGMQTMRVPIPQGLSIIGRSAGLAQIVDRAEGVSRTHLEIECEGSAVRIRDLASRNGTLLGGEPMIPYKEYALRSGESFRLAGSEGPKYTLDRN